MPPCGLVYLRRNDKRSIHEQQHSFMTKCAGNVKADIYFDWDLALQLAQKVQANFHSDSRRIRTFFHLFAALKVPNKHSPTQPKRERATHLQPDRSHVLPRSQNASAHDMLITPLLPSLSCHSYFSTFVPISYRYSSPLQRRSTQDSP